MNSLNSDLICFFDSGIGGLTLLAECVKSLPDKKFVYFADNYNVPYGSKTQSQLIEITDKFFCSISKLNPAAAVLGCNTVTAQCVGYLREKFPFPIVGIQPAVKPAATYGQSCVVLSTPATAESQSMANLVARYGKGVTKVVGCPCLAAYIEQNIFDLQEKELDKLLPDMQTDAVVLGCTHFVYIKEYIKNRYNCAVFDGNEGTARHLCEILGKNDHFGSKNSPQPSLSAVNELKLLENVAFSGGNEEKNSLIFRFLVEGRG